MAFQHNVIGRIVQWNLQAKTMSVRHDVNHGARSRERASAFVLDFPVIVTMEHHGRLRLADVHAGQWVMVRHVTAQSTRIAKDIIVHDLLAAPQQHTLPVGIPGSCRAGMATGSPVIEG